MPQLHRGRSRPPVRPRPSSAVMIPPAAISGSSVTSRTASSNSIVRRPPGRAQAALVRTCRDARPPPRPERSGHRARRSPPPPPRLQLGDGYPDAAASLVSVSTMSGGRAAEREAHDRHRPAHQVGELRRPVVVIPGRITDGGIEPGRVAAERAEIRGKRPAIGSGRARDEHIDPERRQGPGLDLAQSPRASLSPTCSQPRETPARQPGAASTSRGVETPPAIGATTTGRAALKFATVQFAAMQPRNRPAPPPLPRW